MSMYGYMSAMLVGLTVFEESQRGSGRTEDLLQKLEPGDQIVCMPTHARHIRQRLLDMGKTGVTVTASAPAGNSVYGLHRAKRTYFEHNWVYNNLKIQLEDIEKSYNAITSMTSEQAPSSDDRRPFETTASEIIGMRT